MESGIFCVYGCFIGGRMMKLIDMVHGSDKSVWSWKKIVESSVELLCRFVYSQY